MVRDYFSDREKLVDGPPTLVYDEIPLKVRFEILHAFDTACDSPVFRMNGINYRDPWYHDVALKAAGPIFGEIFRLIPNHNSRVETWMLHKQTTMSQHLDLIEIMFETMINLNARHRHHSTQPLDEVNRYLQRGGVGYQFLPNGHAMKVDSLFMTETATLPSWILLQNPLFSEVNVSFSAAFEKYKLGAFTDCIREARTAFELTLKTICNAKGWAYGPGATNTTYLNICIEQGLFGEVEVAGRNSHFNLLRLLFYEGNEATHNPPISEQREATFVLHLLTSNILYVVDNYHATL